MAKVFKNIKGLFFEETDSPKEKKSTSEKESRPASQDENKHSGYQGTLTVEDIEGDSDKFLQILVDAMNASNPEGFDYLEYKQSIRNLKKMNEEGMDEETIYKSAYAMAKTLGVDAQSLVNSAAYYLDSLEKEEIKFQNALSNQYKRKIQQKDQELKSLEESMIEKQKQIEELQQQIEETKSQHAELKQEINQSSAKIDSTKDQFHTSYGQIVDQIKKDVDNIQKYL